MLGWGILCVVLAQGLAALVQPASTPVVFPLRAVHISGNWGTNELVVADWHAGRTATLVPADYLAWLRYLHVNWVGISVALTYDDSMDSTVERNREHVSGEDASFSDDALRQMIREFRSHGIDVYLTLAFQTYEAGNSARPAPRWLLGDPGGDGDPCCDRIRREFWPWRPDHLDHARFVADPGGLSATQSVSVTVAGSTLLRVESIAASPFTSAGTAPCPTLSHDTPLSRTSVVIL